MSVHYKFKSNLDYDTVTFDGLHISVADLKKSIMQQKKIGKSSDFDLQITNAQTKEVYEDDESLIPKNTSVIVARVPVVSSNKKTWERSDLPLPVDDDELSGQINFDKVVKSADLVNANASEEDKVKAMISQSSQEYDPSKYVKSRSMTGPLPPTYTCFRCGKQGHWIKNCPTNNIDIKRSTGIPRSFMVPVDGPEHKGALLTSSGEYAVPLIDHVAYKEVKKEKPPFVNFPEPEAEPEAQIPEELLCMVCRDLLQDAVLIPCCGNSFCDECVRQVLLDSDNHECPLCHETGISPDTVIPNRFLRTAVLNFRNETGYTRVKRVPQIPFPQPSHMDSPQPSPDSTVENQVPPADPVVEEAPVEDNAVVPVATVPEPVELESNQPLEDAQQTSDPPVQDETDENVEQSNEDLQPGTPLADEPPVNNVPELELNEQEQYSNHNQYDEENKFSYSHYYNENMDSDSRDEGHVSSSEISQISTIETITTRLNYKPRSDRPPHSFSQPRPGHHGHTRDPDSTSLPPRRGGCSHTYRSKPQDWSKGSLTVLVERDYNRDRPDYRDRYDRRNRDRLPNTGRFPQPSHSRYERQPREPRYNPSEYHSENRREYRDYSNNSELREDVNYEIRTNPGKPPHSHTSRYNSPPAIEHAQNKLNVAPPPLPPPPPPPPPPAQVLPRPHGMPPLTVAQPFPPQPPPPGSSPIDSSAQPPPPGVGPLPPPPNVLADPPTSYKPPNFEPNEKKPELPRETETMSYDDRINKFTRDLQRSRSRDRQLRSRSRSRSDWSRSSSRTPIYRSSKSSSRSLSRTPSRSSRSRSQSSYFSRSRSHSRSYSLSRSRSRSKSRSYSRSRSLSRSRTRSRSRSRVRHRYASRERIRSPIVSISHSSSLSPKISRPQSRRSPFQVKQSYTPSAYKPSYPTQYGGNLAPPPAPAVPPPPLPHNVIRPHPSHQMHNVQPIAHPPPVNHYNTSDEYHPERPSMYGHNYDDQYHVYNSYQRPYIPPRYEPRNARYNKPPQEHPRHSEEVPLRIPGWIGDRRRNYKSGYQQQRESREQQQRRENSKVVRVIHQEIKTPYVCEIKEEPSLKKTEDKSLNKHKKHHHHIHTIDKSLSKHKKHHHPTKELRKQDNDVFPMSENRSETPVNLIKVEVLPDAVVSDKTSLKTEVQQAQEKLKKHKYKKYKTVEQIERKKKPSKKEKSSSIVSIEPDSTTKLKAKKKKSKTKEGNEGLKKKSKSKHAKVVTVSSNEVSDVHVSETTVIPDENVQSDYKVDTKEEANEPSATDVEEKVEVGVNDNMPELETAKEEVNESSESKIVPDPDKDKELDPLDEFHETAENTVEEALLDGTDEVNVEDADDTTLHVEPPAISKWEREEYDEEIVRPQRRIAALVHKEEKESLSSDIIQRAEKAILQKPLKTAIVTTHPAREKHNSKCDRKVTKHENSPDEKASDRMPFADEYAQLKSAAGVDCGPDESPTLQVTICTDKDKRSVHAKKKSESRSSLKEENSNLKRLKLDRSKFMDKSSDSGASQSAQRTIVVAESSSKSNSKHGDWQRTFEDGEIKDAKYEKTKIIVSKRASDHGHQSFKERGSSHSMQKYSDPDFSYPKDVKRRKCENSDRDDKGVHDKTRFYGSHSLEDKERSKKHIFDCGENKMSKLRSRSKEKKDVGLKLKHVGNSQSRSKSYDSSESFPSKQKQIVKKHHRPKCSAQSHKHRNEESTTIRVAVNDTVKTNRENKMHDRKSDRISSKDSRDDHRPSKRRDISHDESGFEPNYDGTSESDHSIRMGRSDSRGKPLSKGSKRSSSSFTDNEAKRLKQDRPTSSAPLNDPQRNKAEHIPLGTIKDGASSGESSSYQSESDSSLSEGGRKVSKNKSPESEHKHKHKKSKHKKHKKHKHKHKKKKSHKSKQKD